MIDLKGRNIKVAEMNQTSSFFLCASSSARHFTTFDVRNLATLASGARHSALTSSTQSLQTIYVAGKNITSTYIVIPAKARIFNASIYEIPAFAEMTMGMSKCLRDKQVTEHA